MIPVVGCTNRAATSSLSPALSGHKMVGFCLAEELLAKSSLMEYARRGAQARIAELHDELNEIYRQFPDQRRAGKQAMKAVAETLNVRLRRRKRKPMTAAQKKAVSARMKKYWAGKRKAKASR